MISAPVHLFAYFASNPEPDRRDDPLGVMLSLDRCCLLPMSKCPRNSRGVLRQRRFLPPKVLLTCRLFGAVLFRSGGRVI